jgi:hypothetical protein
LTTLYADADIAPDLVTMLTHAGHDVMTATELGLRESVRER